MSLQISSVVPVHNGGHMLAQCLDALLVAGLSAQRIVIVDDASTDGVAKKLSTDGNFRYTTASAVSNPKPVGPARARNAGAAILADADLLMFVDADVIVHANTVNAFELLLNRQPEISAAFGSYDSEPSDLGWISQYKNLLHHYMHQTGKRQAVTFWSGCGVIRKSVFDSVGGFDERYTQASIEDVELGMRLVEAGHRIELRPEIQCSHLKRWTLVNWISTDIFKRAIPWTELLIAKGNALPDNLNLRLGERISAVLALGSLTSAMLALLSVGADGWFAVVAVLFVVGFLISQRRLFWFFVRKKGLAFGTFSLLCHMLYLILASISYAFVQFRAKFQSHDPQV